MDRCLLREPGTLHRSFVDAMVVSKGLCLERKFSEVQHGDSLDILAEILLRCPGHNVCRSAVHGQTFITDAELPEGHPTFSLLNAQVIFGGRHPWLKVVTATQVLQHASIDMSNFAKVIETCAGIGAVSTAMQFCNATTSVFVEQNQKYCDWLKQKTEIPVVHGDIGNPFTIKDVSILTDEIPQPISGGFSCQPFSALGDRREELDPRSHALSSLLKMGFHLRSPVITLECTKEAMDSKWVQQQLNDFCARQDTN